jgi:hypothetical protein
MLTLSFSSEGSPALQYSFAAGCHTRPIKNNFKKSASNVRSQLDGQDNPLRTFHGIFFKGRETLRGHNTTFISDEFERVNQCMVIPFLMKTTKEKYLPTKRNGSFARNLIGQLVVNDLQKTRLSRCHMIWLLPNPSPSPVSKLSLFLSQGGGS